MSALGHKRTLTASLYVRFTPKNGHSQCLHQCLLSAISGHRYDQESNESISRSTVRSLSRTKRRVRAQAAA